LSKNSLFSAFQYMNYFNINIKNSELWHTEKVLYNVRTDSLLQ
jgi:hypothetical protein